MVIHSGTGTGPIAPRSHQCPTTPSAGGEPITPPSLDTRNTPGCIPRAVPPSEGRERGCCAALSLRRRAGSVPAGATASLQTSLTPPKVTLSLLQPGPGTPGGDGALGGHPGQAGSEPPVPQPQRGHPQGWGMLRSAHPSPHPPAPSPTQVPQAPRQSQPGGSGPLLHAGALPIIPALRRLSGSRSLAGSIHNGYCS